MSIGDVKSDARGSGARYNDGKTEYSLIPLGCLEWAAQVFMYGRDNKYAAWNWAKGMDWLVPYDCMMRHMEAWHRGEDLDDESGLPHLGHAMCNLIMMTFYAKFYPEGDNRPKRELFSQTPHAKPGTVTYVKNLHDLSKPASDTKRYNNLGNSSHD